MRSFSTVWLALSAMACAAPPIAPAALPQPPSPTAPPPHAEPRAAPPPVVTDTPAAPTPPTPPPAPPPVTVSIEIEDPYKMEERVEPTTKESWWAQFREHQMWNKGDLGVLTGDLPEVDGHPDPRVIVNIDRVEGAHTAAKLQRIARKFHWINVVRCYRLGAYKDRELRGWTKARMVVSTAGRVLRPKLLETELENDDVSKCVVDKLRTLKFPRAPKSSRAWVDIRVGPGDEPMPPPKDLIVPGDGELAVEKMRAGVEAGLPAFEACYRAAFSYAPALWGRIVIRFHVTDRGVLDEAFEAGSYFPDPRVRQCVVHAARKLKFARPKNGDIRFFAPIRFSNSRSQIGDPNARKSSQKSR